MDIILTIIIILLFIDLIRKKKNGEGLLRKLGRFVYSLLKSIGRFLLKLLKQLLRFLWFLLIRLLRWAAWTLKEFVGFLFQSIWKLFQILSER